MAVKTSDVTAELRRRGIADVDDGAGTRARYSTDASLYRVVPQVVVRPRSTEEILATVDVALATGVPITARGAGTSIAGNAVGTGIVLDVARHLDAVHEIDPEARTARVDPGVVHATLQRAAAPHGLRYGPDPSTHTRCTVGGMIGNNACGNRALGYGRSADNVAALDLVTGTGERLRVGRERATGDSSSLSRVKELVDQNLALVRTEFGRFGRQVSGYSLEHLLPEKGFDVASFLAGSEGTLGLFLEATVDLVSAPSHVHLLVLGYASMAEAADDVTAILPFGPIACEGLGARIVEVFAAAHGPAAMPAYPAGGGFLYVELAGDDPRELAAEADRVVAAAAAVDHRHVTSRAEQAIFWRIREEGAGLSSRIWDRPALSGWEDAAVPPASLGAYLREFEQLMAQHDVHGVPFGHFGDGCVHVRIDFPLDADGGRRIYRDFITDAAGLTAAHGGSFSGEHGDGRARSELLPLMYSAEAIGLFGAVKEVFDPQNLLNPGVLVDPEPLDASLRGQHRDWAPGLTRSRRGLHLLHDQVEVGGVAEGSFGAAVHRCTGVGKCLADNSGSGGVMCPSFQATRDEKDSTRGRARTLQEMVDGRVVTGGWRSPEVHEALDLCLACKGCLNDCPTGVDMASYKSEVLYQSYRGRLRPRSHYILGRLPFWSKVISPVARLVNASLRVPGLVHVARWVAGVDQRRSLPAFATRRFSTWFGRRTPPSSMKEVYRDPEGPGKPRVLLWVDSFTEYMETSGGQALVELLEDAGYTVETLAEPACCGLTWITTGQLDAARARLGRTIDLLHPYVTAGIPIVGIEPSCTGVLRSDAVELLDDPRAAEVAAGVFTAAELLVRTDRWTPPDLTGTTVIVQPHCHQASVMGFDADLAVLERTGATVQRLGGCCGLAGNFGVEKGHYEVSVAVAEHQLLPAVREAPEGAVVVADGFSCRTQLDDLAGVHALTLAQLLEKTTP